jgi:hypothetical protein
MTLADPVLCGAQLQSPGRPPAAVLELQRRSVLGPEWHPGCGAFISPALNW